MLLMIQPPWKQGHPKYQGDCMEVFQPKTWSSLRKINCQNMSGNLQKKKVGYIMG